MPKGTLKFCFMYVNVSFEKLHDNIAYYSLLLSGYNILNV